MKQTLLSFFIPSVLALAVYFPPTLQSSLFLHGTFDWKAGLPECDILWGNFIHYTGTLREIVNIRNEVPVLTTEVPVLTTEVLPHPRLEGSRTEDGVTQNQ